MSAEIIAFKKREKPKIKPAPVPSRRWDALDALRGLCIVGMILLTGFGVPEARRHGIEPGQLVSAGLLFCMGMAIPLSLARRAARQSRWRLTLHVALRTVILVALGVVLSNVPGTTLAQLQIAGPLQYAGVCYGLAATLCLLIGRKSDADFSLRLWPVAVAAITTLTVYAGCLLAWRLLPGNGLGNMVAIYDGFDPIALTAVLGGLGVVLLGVLAALFIRRHGVRNVLAGLAFLGVLLFVIGGGLASILPVDGELWTPSFALITGGIALIVFALVALVTEIPGVKAVAYPLRVFGGNALLAFAAATIVARTWPMTPVYAGALLPVIGLPLWGLYLRRIYLTP
jgi:predicted acyltransferase